MMPPQPPQQGSDLKLDGLTREQIKKIQKSLKKPEFMGLLNEYMVQISDPKNKAQYDAYLKQMEQEGELPKHMKLVKLKPEFCFRTQIISNRNKKHEMKFFVNMCSSEFIDKPSCEAAKDDKGGVGYNWKIPNSLGKIRYDQDKHKNPCQVIDCGFHPDTFIFANQNTAFQAMIISIALEGSERQLGERKETLSRDYIILKNVKCKGENGEPALLPIRYIDGKAYNKGEGPTEPQRNLEGKETKLQKEIGKQKEQYQAEKKKQQELKKKQKEDEMEQDLGDGEKQKKLIEDLETGIHAPKFTSIYTYVTDYSQFIDGPTKKSRSLPSSFTVQFKVPRMENIAEADTLQINEKKIILSVKGKYYIDLAFEDMKVKNYPLKHGEAKAKFDKKKKTLRVQIPVDISAIPEQELPQYKSPEQVVKEEDEAKVVENEVWKNKVLQIPDQEESKKFLPQVEAQQKPAKKLVEQIDQDDVVQEAQQIKEKEDENQQEIEQRGHQNTYVSKKFTTSVYYGHTATIQHPKSAVVEGLNYIFKQTAQYVVITIYMRNYNLSDIEFKFDENRGELILLWFEKKANAVHLAIQQKYQSKIKKAEFLRRVGFCALTIQKQKRGEMWGQQCIRDQIKTEGVKSIEHYERGLQRIEQQAQKIKVKQKEETKAKHQQKQSIQKQAQNKINSQNKLRSKIEQIDETIQKPQQKSAKDAKNNSQNEETNLFQKLPIQFLKFNVNFIETLN